MFYLGLHLALVPLCTKFSETSSNSSLDIKQKPFKMTLNDLVNKVKVTRFELGFALPWQFCVPNLVRDCQIFLQILSGNQFR